MCGVLVQQDTRACYIFTPLVWMFPLSHRPSILTRCVQLRPACVSANEFSPSRSSSATYQSCVISSISFWLSWAIMCRCKWLLPQGPGGGRRQPCWCSPSNGNDLSFQTLISMGATKRKHTNQHLSRYTARTVNRELNSFTDIAERASAGYLFQGQSSGQTVPPAGQHGNVPFTKRGWTTLNCRRQ